MWNRRPWLSILLVAGLVTAISACSSTPARESTGEYLDSSVITTKVKAKLAAWPVTSAAAINVETFKRVVQLSGFVATQEEAVEAERLAKAVEGVAHVENKLTVTLGVGSLPATSTERQHSAVLGDGLNDALAPGQVLRCGHVTLHTSGRHG